MSSSFDFRNFLILPGYGGSGPDHWQTRWERANLHFKRVEAPDWEHPVRDVWVKNLDNAVRSAGPGVVLVAHSLACLQVAHWASEHADTARGIRAALLVAPPDPSAPVYPDTIIGFAPVPGIPFPFRATVVYSTDDPYATEAWTQRMARVWGASAVSVGARGHINAASGLGAWSEGMKLLDELTGG